jgi:signal transduction histidine kinase
VSNASLRRRLFVWLASFILVAGTLAAAIAFALAWNDTNDLLDSQLVEAATMVGRESLTRPAPTFAPRTHEEAETHLVVKLIGSGTPVADPSTDVELPASLAAGLQTLEQSGFRWRVIVATDSAGRRFGIAQRMTVRDEAALEAALLTLVPLLALVPVLLLVVAWVLKRAFEPMTRLSHAADRLTDSHVVPLDERDIPLETLPLLQAVNRLVRRLGLALEQQRRFVSDAAHELRTPLAILAVQADNVQRVELSPEARERMEALRQGLARMASLVEQLLDFARVQGASPAVPQPFELAGLVRSAIEESLPAAQSKRVDLGCVRMDPASVVGDRTHAYALVRNAIDNAVRYTAAGGAVDVSLSVEDGVARFVVEDTGPGIPPAELERVFEPFVRILGTQQAGSGLGLAIARTAANALGGRIELGSRTDRRSGLRFTYCQALAA